MLIIRKAQMDAFEESGLNNFEDSMVDHVQMYFPNHHRIAGEPVIRDVVRYGIERAKRYELISERDVSLYITVMFILGSNFDNDFMYPWAGKLLAGTTGDASGRVNQLADSTVDFMKKIGGPENRSINHAFQNLHKELPELRSCQKNDQFEQYMQPKLKQIYPEKYQILGEEIIDQLITRGIAAASQYTLKAQNSSALVIAMMFFMGSSIDRDPFLPWLGALLTEQSTPDNPGREDRLFTESTVFLGKWLEKP